MTITFMLRGESERIAFAARRRKTQAHLIRVLEPVVAKALKAKKRGTVSWFRQVVDAAHPLFDRIITDDGGEPTKSVGAWAHTALDITNALTKTKTIDAHSAQVIATMVAGQVLDSATIAAAQQAGEPYELEWVSMHDSKVRHTHRDVDGQRIKPGDKFQVGESEMRHPHDTTADIKEWINCRCTVAAVPVPQNEAASGNTVPAPRGATMKTQGLAQFAVDGTGLLPWHGPLAPEGVWSGDGRRFAEGSLSHRDLPLPLTWQEKAAPGHDDAEVVASIEWMEKRGNVMHGGGHMLQTDAADKFVGLMAHFGRFGVSVDADDAEMELEMAEDGEDMTGRVTFTMARICAASGVPIPAFQEAWVTLGEDPEHDYGTPEDPEALVAALAQMALDFGSEQQFDLGQTRAVKVFEIEDLTDVPEDSQCLFQGCDNPPTKAVSTDDPMWFGLWCDEHAADAEDKPLELGVDRESFGRGPGWITNPEDTKRIHDYWTRPGEPGYAKIGWGTPGDFNRCRTEVGQEIAEEDPAKAAKFINQICAQWHKDATGFWPGHAPTEGGSLETPEGEMAPALSIVASAASATPPGSWFTDPGLEGPTPITFEDVDGMTHMFGHVNLVGLCHMGFNTGECVNPGPSNSEYAIFRCGEVMTTDGPVATGPVTVGTGHADTRLGMRPALAHYDNTGTAVADVAAGDDEHGTWINGWVRPWASEEQKYELRAHPPSGDWRRNPNTGDFDMIAVLAVNAPGLPVRRVGFSNGSQVALVASTGVIETAQPEEDVVEDIAERIAAALEERAERRETVAAMAADFGEGD